MNKPLCMLLLTLTMVPGAEVWAQQDGPGQEAQQQIAAERERLQRDRVQIEQAHDERMRQCWQRFAVNDCLREVRRSRRVQLEPLRQRELELNALERAWRTQQRDERLQDKSQERRP